MFHISIWGTWRFVWWG